MKTRTNDLSITRLNRLREQGYVSQNYQEINDLAYGNRFAYRVCTSILLIGVVSANIPLLSVMMLIAFLSIVLPNHLFDYVYNYFLAKKMNKPQLPPRSAQLKFSCTIATLWIGATIYLFSAHMMIAGYVMGGLLIGIATLVGTIDLCIPSIMYNALFAKKKSTAPLNI